MPIYVSRVVLLSLRVAGLSYRRANAMSLSLPASLELSPPEVSLQGGGLL